MHAARWTIRLVSRLAAGLTRVQGSATARNWRTVTALLSMLDG